MLSDGCHAMPEFRRGASAHARRERRKREAALFVAEVPAVFVIASFQILLRLFIEFRQIVTPRITITFDISACCRLIAAVAAIFATPDFPMLILAYFSFHADA